MRPHKDDGAAALVGLFNHGPQDRMELQMSHNKIQTGAAFALVRTDVTRTNNSSDSLHLIKR